MTKDVTLARQPSTDEGTFGSLLFGNSALYSTELPWRENATRKSSIPEGTYDCIWARSPRFGFCYHLLDVPGRSHILIHSANFGGDTELGWTSELLGCIAPALKLGKLKNNFGKPQQAGMSSRAALTIFESWANQENLRLVIRSALPAANSGALAA
jgi:hypothetical protein